MPEPLIYQQPKADELLQTSGTENLPYEGVLYATDRAPVPYEKRTDKLREYSKQRYDFLSVGVNKVVFDKYGKKQLSVDQVQSFGVLASKPLFGPLSSKERLNELKSADEQFASLINDKLEVSAQKDIFVYVHGAHDSFENPALVAGELWHHLGYEGVLVNFLWPTTRARFGYFKDVENAQASGSSLSMLIDFLSENTKAQNIHLISHSAGGRVVAQALYEKAIANESRNQTRIGQVVLIASDYSADLMGVALAKGISGQTQQLTTYVSKTDTALGVSRFLFKLKRLGQLGKNESFDSNLINYFDNNNFAVIDVSDAPDIRPKHGHSYFRSSSWVSSDVVAILRLGLEPDSRGLERLSGELPWVFPLNYVDKLQQSLTAARQAKD